MVAGLEHARRVRVDVAALLESHLKLHERRAADLGVAIAFDHGDGAFEASADPAQIGVVFENLIVNALDAMPAGGQLRVGLSSTSDGLLMTFADTGQGMDPSVERQAFTPFFSTKPGGAGIGLAISRRILDMHGGSIRCETAPGAGSTFIVTLPREQADGDESSAESGG
jgi:signal transduction histidine kinase